jgi:hypothetical protein
MGRLVGPLKLTIGFHGTGPTVRGFDIRRARIFSALGPVGRYEFVWGTYPSGSESAVSNDLAMLGPTLRGMTAPKRLSSRRSCVRTTRD